MHDLSLEIQCEVKFILYIFSKYAIKLYFFSPSIEPNDPDNLNATPRNQFIFKLCPSIKVQFVKNCAFLRYLNLFTAIKKKKTLLKIFQA